MRVLQVHSRHRFPGGEDAVVEREGSLLRAAGHDVTTYEVANPTRPLAAARTFALAPWNPLASRDVINAAKRSDAEVAHVHNTWFSLSPAVVTALARAGIPVVATLHNFRSACINGNLLRDNLSCELCVGTNPFQGVRHRCYRDSTVMSAIAASTIALTRHRRVWQQDVAQFIALEAGAVPILVASGIPEHLITICPNVANDPGERPEPPSASNYVVYVGRLSEEKGLDVLLDAWQASKLDPLRLVVYGDGPIRDRLETRGIPGVRFAGRVDHATLITNLLAARALVFPSICREAGPLAPIEAAAAGLPIIVSSHVGIASRVKEADAGWSVAPRDPQTLASALFELLDGDAIDRAGKHSREMYEAFHTTDRARRSLEAIYENAVLQAGNTRVNSNR